MKSELLCVIKENCTGEIGLVLKNLNINDDMPMVAITGETIAHDLLEHVNGIDKIGTIQDELQALGALWFVRGQFGYLRKIESFHSVETNIASDVSRMAMDYIKNIYHDEITKLKTKRVDECETEFQEILNIAKTRFNTEIRYSEPLTNEEKSNADYYFSQVIHNLRKGYRKAVTKYKGEPAKTNNLFWAITDAINKAIKYNETFEGLEFKLSYGFNKNGCAVAYVNEHFNEDY